MFVYYITVVERYTHEIKKALKIFDTHKYIMGEIQYFSNHNQIWPARSYNVSIEPTFGLEG